MRLRIISILVLSNSFAFSQEFKNFQWNGTEIEWQNIYHTEGSIDSIKSAFLKSKSLLSYEIIDDSTLIGEIKGVTGVCDGTESRHTSQSMSAYSKGTITGTAKIDFKEGKYRVTVFSLKIDPKSGISDIENQEPFENWYWNRSKKDFKTAYAKDDLICFDKGFSIQFALIEEEKW